jgi:hypothetical protein
MLDDLSTSIVYNEVDMLLRANCLTIASALKPLE